MYWPWKPTAKKMQAETTSDTNRMTTISSTIFDSRYETVLYRPSLRSLHFNFPSEHYQAPDMNSKSSHARGSLPVWSIDAALFTASTRETIATARRMVRGRPFGILSSTLHVADQK